MILLQRNNIASEDIASMLLTFIKNGTPPTDTVLEIRGKKDRTKIDRAKALIERENNSKALQILQDANTFAPAAGLFNKLRTKVLLEPTPADFDLPEKSRTTPQITIEGIRQQLKKLKNCITPGTGMLANEHLKHLAFYSAPHAMTLLTTIIHSIIDGAVPQHIKEIIYTDPLKGITKPDGGVRPICIGHTITKIAMKMTITSVPKKSVGPRQFGYGKRYGTQRAAIELQRQLDSGKIIIKTDLANAFNSVPRPQLAAFLFDNYATKPLWRYYWDRYHNETVYSIFDGGNNFVSEITANVGINQGDAASLLLFDIYLSDCPRHIENATIFQIHDDIYAACDPQHSAEVLQQLARYISKKGLTMNAAKTKILCGKDVDLGQLQQHAISSATKVGGIFIQPTPEPLPSQQAADYVTFDGLDQLPLQHQLSLFQHCIKAKWRYALDAGHPTIVSTIVEQISGFQSSLLQRLLAPTASIIEYVNEDQLTEDARRGGLGFFSYKDRRQTIIEGIKEPKPPPSAWFESLNNASKAASTFTHPVVTLIPTSPWLRLDDTSLSAYISTLLDAWPPKNIKCDMKDEAINIPKTKAGSHAVQRHLLGCSSCAGGLKTFRHDAVNQGIATVLRRHGAIYVEEPKNWPLRTKTSNSGKDGPDGMVHFGTSIFWTDITVTSQDSKSSHCSMTHAYTSKVGTYSAAAENGIEVLPVVFGHLGAFAGKCRVFEQKVKEINSRAWREMNNIVGVRLAKSLGLYMKHLSVKGSKVTQ